MDSNANHATLYRCGAIRDAMGCAHRPGAVLVSRDDVILVAGAMEDVEQARAELDSVDTVDLPDTLVMPAMVNVHAHLDLHAIGPVAHDGGFVDWVAEHVMPYRADANETTLRTSVLAGLEASRSAGIGALGDIAASVTAIESRCTALRDAALPGISWVECVGLGDAANAALQRESDVAEMVCRVGIDADTTGVHIDRQPHAPYSADPQLYRSDAMRCGSTHLAETMDEARFVMDGSGAITEFRKSIGRWNSSIQGWGKTPVQHFCSIAQPADWVIAHCNYVSDGDIAALQGFPGAITIAYCPVASEYFGHQHHRYRDMLAAGLNVALGTDSILCQPTDEAQPMGILPQMRRLYRRDRTDPTLLLALATTHGVRALRASGDPWRATLHTGDRARLIGAKFDVDDTTDPLEQVLLNHEPVRVICFDRSE